MRVARERQIRAEAAVFAAEEVVPVRQQEPEGLAVGAVNVGGHLLGRFLIGVAVRVVDPREDDRVPAALRRDGGVAQVRHARLLKNLPQRGHQPGGPLVVAGDVVRRRNRDESAQQRGHKIHARVLVREVAADGDEIGLCRLHGLEQADIIGTELLAVQVGQHDDACPVPSVRQALGCVGVFLG